MAESVHEGPGAKPVAKTGAENSAPAAGPTGKRGGHIGELLNLSRHIGELLSLSSHIADVAGRLDNELRVSGSFTNQVSALAEALSEQSQANMKAEVEIANLRLRLQGERDRRNRAANELLQLRKALETMQLGVTIADQNGIIVYVNPADAKIHGYTVDELLGKDVGIYAVEFQHRPLSVAKLRTLRSFQRETFNRRKDGSIFKVRLLSDVVWNSDGDPVGLVTMCEDLQGKAGAEPVDEEPPRPKSAARTAKKTKKVKR